METIRSVKSLINMAPDVVSPDSVEVTALEVKVSDGQNVSRVSLLERLKSMKDGRILDQYLCWFFQIDP